MNLKDVAIQERRKCAELALDVRRELVRQAYRGKLNLTDEHVAHVCDALAERMLEGNGEAKAAEPMYYIQARGFSGDCFLFWRRGRCGYTTDLSDAMQVGKAEADRITADKDRGDKAWPVADLDRIAERHVNSEHAMFRGRNHAG
jgi:hypothetical protein